MKHSVDFEQTLASEPLAHALTPAQRSLMYQHWQHVLAWNQRTNLTAIREDSQAAAHHYADSLAASEHLTSGSVVDIGSGAGFPGIPLAIARPDLSLCLLEPRRKRVSFLQSSIARLGLSNVTVVNGRLQDTPTELFGAAVTRATFSSDEDLKLCLSWLQPGAAFLAYRSETSEILKGSERISYAAGGTRRVLDRLCV